jgi:hypothetical protein
MILAEGHPLFPADVLHFPFTDRIAPFDRAERSLRRGRSFLLCLLLRCAFRAEALEDRGMRIDSPGIAPLRERTQVGRCLGIERLVFMDADVHDLAAADADHMGVLIRTKVEPLPAWRLDRENDALVSQKVEIAIDRGAAQMLVDLVHLIKDLLSRRMVVPGAHLLEHQLALPRVSSLCHASSFPGSRAQRLGSVKLRRVGQKVLDLPLLLSIIITVPDKNASTPLEHARPS